MTFDISTHVFASLQDDDCENNFIVFTQYADNVGKYRQRFFTLNNDAAAEFAERIQMELSFYE